MSKIKFKNGKVEDYTIVLSTRDYRHLGQLTGVKGVNYVGNLNSANELSFTICKYDLLKYDCEENKLIDYDTFVKIKTDLWNQIVDLKLVWIKELNEYYEIKVSITDSKETIKTITATSLCEAELSQTYLYNIEINTEADIERDAYNEDFSTLFYRDPDNQNIYNWGTYDPTDSKTEKYFEFIKDENGSHIKDKNGRKTIDEEATYLKRYNILKSASLMHRILEKVPHYTIKKENIDESLWNLQRNFSIDGNTVYDFFTGECSEQFDCLFQFDSTNREIYVYDLLTVCKDCGHRGDFYDECPECESTNLKYFGEDTTILVDKKNLTESIQFEANVDSVKNCFKLVAGDEVITAAIRDINPNGSDYIYYFSENQLNDMPEELKNKLNKYNELVKSKEKYAQELVKKIYDLTDKIGYLTHSMMPKVENVEEIPTIENITNPKRGYLYVYEDVVYLFNEKGNKFEAQTEDSELYSTLGTSFISASIEAEKLNEENLNPLGVSKVSQQTVTETINTTLENYAKIFVKSGYVKIKANAIEDFKYVGLDEDGWAYGIWYGTFTVTNYSDKEDVVTTEPIKIKVYNNANNYKKQQILKQIAGYNDDDDKEFSVFDALSIDDLEDFGKAIKLYSSTRLKSFCDALDAAKTEIGTLKDSKEYQDIYKEFSTIYNNKYDVCIEEYNSRNTEIEVLTKQLNAENVKQAALQKELDFETNMGEYFNTFCAYRREDKYSNDTYLSDGLDNAEKIKKASEFIETAKKELKKSGEMQYTLSSTLYNLLVLKEFKPIVDKFELGNWIRVKVDGIWYRLRLISYTIDFDNLQTINVEFSTVTEVKDAAFEAQEIIGSAKSMSSTYSYVSKQAEKGNKAQSNIQDWHQNGLNSSLIQIQNNVNEEVTYGKNGILCRSYDDTTGEYDKEQLKLTHNLLVFTRDNWNSVVCALGKHYYSRYNNDGIREDNIEGYGLNSDFVTAGYITGSQIIGGYIYSDNYSAIDSTGSFIDLRNGKFSFAGGKLTFDPETGVLAIESQSIVDSMDQVELTSEKLHIYAKNIINDITSDQIASLDASKITGTIDKSKIGGVYSNLIDGKIKDSQIESLSVGKLDGTISSSMIDVALTNKTISGGSLLIGSKSATYTEILDSGELNCSNANIKSLTASSINVIDSNDTSHVGVTGEYTIGNTVLKIVNGIIVNVTQTQTN